MTTTEVVDDYRLTLGKTEYVPIVIGGMGVDISTRDLALEAARLGGIGHISDAMVLRVADKTLGTHYTQTKNETHLANKGNLDKHRVKFDLADVYHAQRRTVERAMTEKHGSGGVFINVMEKLTMGAPKDTLRVRLQAALDGGIDGITLSAGLHTHSLSLIADHARLHDAKIGIIVSSPRALKIFLRGANRIRRMPDYVIVEGPLAGGHLGFGDDWAEYRLQDIVQDILGMLRDASLTIPVIPAGGIFTGTDAVEYLQTGAAAVQVATRFTITAQAGLSAKAKQAYFSANEEDVIVSAQSPTGYPLRMLSTSPCLGSSVEPQCEPFGYALDANGACAYLDAYAATGHDAGGRKLSVRDKICLCYHFSRNNCYTCGHYVYRLSDTSNRLADGSFQLPSAEHVFEDYRLSRAHEIALPRNPVEPGPLTDLGA